MENNQPVINNTAPLNVTDETSKSRLSVPLMMIGLILLLLVGAGSYMLGQRSEKQTIALVTPTIVPTLAALSVKVISTPNATDFTNWNPYNDQNANVPFSFLYPSDWHLNTNAVGGGVPGVTVSKNIIPNTGSRSSACFSVYEGLWPSYVTLEQIIQDEDTTQSQQTATSPLLLHKPKKIVSQSQITVDNIVGIKRNIIRYDEDTTSTEIYLAYKDPNTNAQSDISIFKIQTCQNTDDAIVNKILSSFKVKK